MAHFSIRFFSNCLVRPVRFEMIIPNDFRGETPENRGKTRTLFLLHGWSADGDNWIPEYLAEKYNFAIVTPNGENGFWLDGISTGHKFGTFVGVELADYIRRTFGLAQSPEETYIMGTSMGGFGALRTALKYPETFGKAVGLSSALILYDIAGMKPGESTDMANYEYYRECFGDLDRVTESENDPEFLVKRLKERGEKFPEIYMACGTEDFLLEHNRRFHDFLEKNGVAHTYSESRGGHDMVFWNEYAKKFIEEMFGST
ncbi:MAG: alpha/beta fold hydrolase [Ruminococcus sp.]|nr:alpha/beta fold hydrolase [Ruminococcus sp.]MCM1382529.1 alpha/beta fold hydrolase [Muribaculaceae bacterium]MCM1478674.1 alpha/beta fold hydrolase [Muribaculaceae bacterium]